MSTIGSTTMPATLNPSAHTDRPQSVGGRNWRKRFAWSVTGLAVAGLVVGSFLASREPTLFDPVEAARASLPEGMSTPPRGAVLTATVAGIADILLAKPGGFLSNDVLPPLSLLDNMPSWEYGVLTELRDTVRAMRNDFGRAQSQSQENLDLVTADAQFHFSPESWMLPASEHEYALGTEALRRYLAGLTDDNGAKFFARADNLNFYMATVEKRLGNLSQRLSASARLPAFGNRIDGTGHDEAVFAGGTLLGTGRVSWFDADNVFFEARGYLWALIHTLKALEHEFAPILASKQATVPMHEIILKLELAQQRVWSPVILTSSGFGVLTNHSLVLASYISRANAAIIDLRMLLSEG